MFRRLLKASGRRGRKSPSDWERFQAMRTLDMIADGDPRMSALLAARLDPEVFETGEIDAQAFDHRKEGGTLGLVFRGGATNKVRFVGATDARTPGGRTVRLHESLHAKHPPPEELAALSYPDAVIQATEDIRLHSVCWPWDAAESVHMDSIEATEGMLSVLVERWPAACEQMAALMGPEPDKRRAYFPSSEETPVPGAHTLEGARAQVVSAYNTCVIGAALGLGVLTAITTAGGEDARQAAEEAWDRFYYRVNGTLRIRRVVNALYGYVGNHVARVMRCGDPTRCAFDCESIAAAIAKHLITPPSGHAGERPWREDLVSRDMDTVASPMDIELLAPRDRPTHLSRQRVTRKRPFGMKLNGPRLPFAVVNQTTDKLFRVRKTVEQIGGTVLVDASGSMSFSGDDLREIFEHAPAASIAYYNSGGDDRSSTGTLYIIARDGKRYTGAKFPKRGAGNGVDYWALQWALDQEPPVIFVTDGRFCGGPAGQARATTEVVERAKTYGVLSIAGDVEEALEIFRARGGRLLS